MNKQPVKEFQKSFNFSLMAKISTTLNSLKLTHLENVKANLLWSSLIIFNGPGLWRKQSPASIPEHRLEDNSKKMGTSSYLNSPSMHVHLLKWHQVEEVLFLTWCNLHWQGFGRICLCLISFSWFPSKHPMPMEASSSQTCSLPLNGPIDQPSMREPYWKNFSPRNREMMKEKK